MYIFNIYSTLSLLCAFVYFFTSVYTLSKKPKSSVNRLFFVVGLTMMFWGLGEGMQRAAVDQEVAQFWAVYILGIGATLHGPILLHFWLDFSGQLNAFKKHIPIIFLYLPMLFFLVIRIVRPELMILELTKETWGYSISGTGLYRLYTLFLVLYVALVVFFAFKKARHSQGNFRKQSINIGLGVLLSQGIGVITQILLPIAGMKVPELSVISTLIFIFFLAYAVSKYGLLVITTAVVSENIIDTMNDFVIALDNNLKIVFINRAAINSSQLAQDKLVGTPIGRLIKTDLFSLDFEDLQKRLPILNHEAEILSHDQRVIPVSMNISSIKEGQSNSMGVVLVMRDMREVRALIDNLQQSKRELESKNSDLEKFNKLAVGRELKMIELKNKIKVLEEKGVGI